jgi:hypothetical protein
MYCDWPGVTRYPAFACRLPNEKLRKYSHQRTDGRGNLYFYSETAPHTTSDINVWKIDGSKVYLRHFDNLLVLEFSAKSGSRAERASIETEILICKRDLSFWERHPKQPHPIARPARILQVDP